MSDGLLIWMENWKERVERHYILTFPRNKTLSLRYFDALGTSVACGFGIPKMRSNASYRRRAWQNNRFVMFH